jgi:hypothetical protein
MLWLIICVLVMGGIAGGFANFFMDPNPGQSSNNIWLRMLRSVILGIAASFMVPLFLKMASSNLIESILGSNKVTSDPANLLVLAGFSLVASICSRSFISTLSDRILKTVQEASETAKAAKDESNEIKTDFYPILIKSKQPEDVEASTLNLAPHPQLLDENQKKVLVTLANGKYTYRTAQGLENEIAIPDTKRILDALRKKNFVGNKMEKTKTGQDIQWWFVTKDGFYALQSLIS